MNKETKIGLFIVGLIFVGGIVLAMIDPSTELVGHILYLLYINTEKILRTIYVALPVMGILYVVVRFVRYRWINKDAIKVRKEARNTHPEFFEEMQSVLRSILLPLGFQEEKVKKRDVDIREPKTYVDFKRDKFTVSLWFYMIDSSYNLDAWHWKKREKDRRKKVNDFSLEGWDISEADEFKSVAIKKLNEWLVEQSIK